MGLKAKPKPVKKKLPGLQPINYVDIATPQLFKKWLSNPIAHKAWEDAVWEVSDDMNVYDRLDYLQLNKKPQNLDKIDPLILGEAMKLYVDTLLGFWTQDSDDETAKRLVASLPLFVEMSKTMPHVNPAEDYKYAYRGTNFTNKEIKQFIENNSNDKNWARTKIGTQKYYTYVGPKSKLFTYKPHRPTQSWTVSEKSAAGFGSVVVATPIDKSFFFDPAFMNQYGYKWENETIHFGKEPMKVALLIDTDTFFTIKNTNTDDLDGDIDDDQQTADEFYDGIYWAMRVDELMRKKKGNFTWYDKNRKKILDLLNKDGYAAVNNYLQGLYNQLFTLKDLTESVELKDDEGTLIIP